MQTAEVGPLLMHNIVEAKFELRRLMRSSRKAFVQQRSSNCLESQWMRDIDAISLIKNAKLASLYIASKYECDVKTPLCQLLGDAVEFALPCVQSKSEDMIFRSWQCGHPLVKSQLGFEQPEERARAVEPDLVLVPLLAFDRTGSRLGQGAGHYDRAFVRYPDALRIGIGWSCQEVDTVPTEAHDLPLDAILTERDLIYSIKSRI